MTPSAEAIDDGFAAVLAQLSGRGEFAWQGYKPSCLRRRVAVRVRATGAPSFGAYAELLQARADEWPRLRDALTVNVTSFLRDAAVYEALRTRVLPALAASVSGPLRVWSAGCSSGQEAYSLAMTLAEVAGLERVDVLATDIDAASLAAARRAEYGAAELAVLPAPWRARWVDVPDADGRATVSAALRARVRVQHHDLLRHEVPAEGLHLVACRNVAIYLARDAQDALHARLIDALAPGGLLVLGLVETLGASARRRLGEVDSRARIYRRDA